MIFKPRSQVTLHGVAFDLIRLRSFAKRHRSSLPSGVVACLKSYGVLGHKLGQILATRFDMIPTDVRESLSQFYGSSTSIPFEELLVSLPSSDQEKLSALSKDFTPVASASIAQVFKTTTPEGVVVAVKIVKPGVKDSLVRSLSSIRRLGRLLLAIPILKGYRPFLLQLEGMLRQELDLLQEAATMETIQSGVTSFVVPQVYWEYSSPQILVMGFLEGASLSSQEATSDRVALASTLLTSFFEQVFKLGVFHADMHPGNFLLHEGKLQLLDWGMVGYLSEQDREYLAYLCLGFLLQDSYLVTHAVLGLCQHGAYDYDKLQSDLFRCMKTYTGFPLGYINFETSLADLLGVLKRHRIFIKPELLSLVKTLVTVQGVSCGLDPDLSLVSVIRGNQRLIAGALLKGAGQRALYKRLGFLT